MHGNLLLGIIRKRIIIVFTMTDKKILVLGATGPAGIVILRELVYRNHATIAYVRNPGKIPADLVNNPLLEVMQTQGLP